MQQYQNVLQDKFGNVIVGASVAVYVYGTTTPATIYSGNGTGLLPSNTVTTSSLGEFAFYAANGRYSLSITATNFALENYSDFILYDPADIGAVAASGVAFTPFSTIAATNVQNAIQEVVSDLAGASGASTVGFAPTGTIAATTVQTAISEVVTDLSASSGSSLVGFLQSGTGATARTVQAKERDIVSVKDFGATGDGTTDDTAAIQAALDSAAKRVVFPAGGIYIVNGGLSVSTVSQVIYAAGATIKLKASASTKYIITTTVGATDVVFAGGIWDGNKANGNATGTTYNSFCVGLFGDRSTCQDIDSINTYGIGIKGFANYLSILNNRIRNTTHYGIFLDGSASTSNIGNRAIGNTVDMSEGQVSGGQNIGQGILFTSGSGQNQLNWEVSNNTVIGPQTSVQDQAINIAVRGKNGIANGNRTSYGAMGFSEGGENSVISNNQFLDITGSVAYGIEPSGKNTVVSNNLVTGAIIGVSVTGSIIYDNLSITGNNITASQKGVYFQISAGYTAQNCIISSNYIYGGSHCIYLTGNTVNTQISSNVLVGPSPTFVSGRGIYLDTPPASAFVFVCNNTIANVQRPYAIYSASVTTFNKLFAISNNLCAAGVNTNSSRWNAEGSAAIGTEVISTNNINPATIGAQYNVIDQSTNLLTMYGSGSPEGAITAGVGSLYLNKSGGASTTLYIKESGTGNTGWVAK